MFFFSSSSSVSDTHFFFFNSQLSLSLSLSTLKKNKVLSTKPRFGVWRIRLRRKKTGRKKGYLSLKKFCFMSFFFLFSLLSLSLFRSLSLCPFPSFLAFSFHQIKRQDDEAKQKKDLNEKRIRVFFVFYFFKPKKLSLSRHLSLSLSLFQHLSLSLSLPQLPKSPTRHRRRPCFSRKRTGS